MVTWLVIAPHETLTSCIPEFHGKISRYFGTVHMTCNQWRDALEHSDCISTRLKDIMKDFRAKVGSVAREAAKV